VTVPSAAPNDTERPDSSRLDAELVRRGLVRSRALAVVAIEQGRVLVDGRAVSKAAS
jgi:23S rRNA (cytidine1920-2'-O)/16S rRNA (cytidine1409-2'-O)-methyltransferase